MAGQKKRGSATAPAPSATEREQIRRVFLAAALCHELKQPLHSLNINVELLGRRLEKPATEVGVAAPLHALGRAVDRISDTLDAYAARALPEPVGAELVRVEPLLEQAAERAREAGARAGVRIVVSAEDLPRLPASAHQLAVALDALLDNAVRASAPGGAVQLRARHKTGDLQIEVADQGHGMSPEIARRAFEIGFSTWDGDGIGLTITKFIAYHHSGGISLRSNPGDGTTAVLVLPLAGDGDGDDLPPSRE